MENRTDEIVRHIELEREQLGRNFDEIESRVKNATNFKTYFNENTLLILGTAAAGGFLLSLALSGSGNRQAPDEESQKLPLATTRPRRLPKQVSKHINGLSSTFDQILEGLVGVASLKLVSLIADKVPGFKHQYDSNQQQRSRDRIYDVEPNFGADKNLSAVD